MHKNCLGITVSIQDVYRDGMTAQVLSGSLGSCTVFSIPLPVLEAHMV